MSEFKLITDISLDPANPGILIITFDVIPMRVQLRIPADRLLDLALVFSDAHRKYKEGKGSHGRN